MHAVLDWLSGVLLENDDPGHCSASSWQENTKTSLDLIHLPFSVPTLSTDHVLHGFDNHGEELVLSPPLMAQYLEIATAAADRVLPSREEEKDRRGNHLCHARRFHSQFHGQHIVDDVLRMTLASDQLARGSVWPNRFEARVAGVSCEDRPFSLSTYRYTRLKCICLPFVLMAKGRQFGEQSDQAG